MERNSLDYNRLGYFNIKCSITIFYYHMKVLGLIKSSGMLSKTLSKCLSHWQTLDIDHLSGKPVPGLYPLMGKEILPNINSEPSLAQRWTVPSCPVTGSPGNGSAPWHWFLLFNSILNMPAQTSSLEMGFFLCLQNSWFPLQQNLRCLRSSFPSCSIQIFSGLYYLF